MIILSNFGCQSHTEFGTLSLVSIQYFCMWNKSLRTIFTLSSISLLVLFLQEYITILVAKMIILSNFYLLFSNLYVFVCRGSSPQNDL